MARCWRTISTVFSGIIPRFNVHLLIGVLEVVERPEYFGIHLVIIRALRHLANAPFIDPQGVFQLIRSNFVRLAR